jgi:hypothetical protein
MIVVELNLSKVPTRLSAASEQDTGEVALENDKVRAVKYSLQPGESSAVRMEGAYVVVALGPGRMSGVCGMRVAKSVPRAGFVCAGSENHQISNVGNAPMAVLEFQLGK